MKRVMLLVAMLLPMVAVAAPDCAAPTPAPADWSDMHAQFRLERPSTDESPPDATYGTEGKLLAADGKTYLTRHIHKDSVTFVLHRPNKADALLRIDKAHAVDIAWQAAELLQVDIWWGRVARSRVMVDVNHWEIKGITDSNHASEIMPCEEKPHA